jgi:hypothetical protein
MEAYFAFLSHLVLFLTLTSLVFATGAYATLVLRRRRPDQGRRKPHGAAQVALLHRYLGERHD